MYFNIILIITGKILNNSVWLEIFQSINPLLSADMTPWSSFHYFYPRSPQTRVAPLYIYIFSFPLAFSVIKTNPFPLPRLMTTPINAMRCRCHSTSPAPPRAPLSAASTTSAFRPNPLGSRSAAGAPGPSCKQHSFHGIQRDLEFEGGGFEFGEL